MRRLPSFATASFAAMIGCGGSVSSNTDASTDSLPADTSSESATSSDTAPQDGTSNTDAIDTVTPADGGAAVPCVELGLLDPWQNRLGSHTLAERGTILSCVHAASVTAAAVSSTPYYTQHGWTAANGYDLYNVQYVSEGARNQPVAVTALFYLPQLTHADIPLVAVDHGTSGMGPLCGPTHTTPVTDYMALPLVGNGYAVVATDYAGMGVDTGVEPYLVGDSEAANAIDAIRAARVFHDSRFDASQLGQNVFVMGHSQGGQASLFTHQRFDASLGNLLGSISFAPALGSVHGFNLLFGSSMSISATMVFVTMALYGQTVYYGTPDPSAWLTSNAQQMLPGMLHDQCLTQLFASIPQMFPTQGDLFAAPFLSAASSCSFQGSCPQFDPWSTEISADVPGQFTSSAPALILQGEQDTTVNPASTKCIVDRLAANGTPVQGCAYPNDDHLTVVGSAMGDVLQWMTARQMGQNPSVCTASIAESCL